MADIGGCLDLCEGESEILDEVKIANDDCLLPSRLSKVKNLLVP